MTAEILYEGQLRTQAVHLKSNTKIVTDAPTDNHGKGESFSPTDLVATALASCMLTVMGIVADRHNWELKGTKATIRKIMESNPRRIGAVEIDIQMAGMNFEEDAKKLLERTALHCPVAKSLNAELEQKVQFIYE